ncbi:hypothetical protein [Nocardia heshunensis]
MARAIGHRPGEPDQRTGDTIVRGDHAPSRSEFVFDLIAGP